MSERRPRIGERVIVTDVYGVEHVGRLIEGSPPTIVLDDGHRFRTEAVSVTPTYGTAENPNWPTSPKDGDMHIIVGKPTIVRFRPRWGTIVALLITYGTIVGLGIIGIITGQ